jgi:hypothetical protein
LFHVKQSPQKPVENRLGMARKALQKALNGFVPKNLQDDEVAFYPDIETLNTYTWKFTYQKRVFALVYDFRDGKVTKVPISRL